jgi:hypothetical protein
MAASKSAWVAAPHVAFTLLTAGPAVADGGAGSKPVVLIAEKLGDAGE